MSNIIKHTVTFFLLVFVGSSLIVSAQTNFNSEEEFLEHTYNKLALYQNAQKKYKLKDGENLTNKNLLRFVIGDIRSGKIDEILDEQVTVLVTPPTGRILKSSTKETNRTNFKNDGKKNITRQFGINVKWVDGQYSSFVDPQITMGEALKQFADRFSGITRYISYDVTVFFEDEVRTYNAIVLLQKAIGSPQKTYFVDNVSSFGGILNEMVDSKKTPVKKPNEKFSQNLKNRSVKFLSAGFKRLSSNSGISSKRNNVCTALSGQSRAPVGFTKSDTSGHSTGNHYIKSDFTPYCSRTTSCDQVCRVTDSNTAKGDKGRISSFFYYHNVVEKGQDNDSTGNIGTIECSSVHGIGVQSCTALGCSGSVTITGSGGSATVSGGNVWNWTHKLTHQCTATPINTTGGNPTYECLPYCQTTGLTDNSKSDGSTSNLIDSCCVLTPIVVDIDGDGFRLTSAENGVMFDFNGDGVPHRMSWTKRNSDEAWVVLDRNGNGTIDDGSEMFGNMTPQPQVDERNGFLALAEYDKIENGGNEDGKINKLDAIFTDLRLWQDKNHNGISESNELKKLRRLNVKAFMLDYRTTNRVDRHGNAFRYKAKVRDTRDGNVGKWAWDVFLVLDEEEE